MAVKADKQGQIAKRTTGGGGGKPEIVTLLERMAPELKKALPRHLSPDRMSRIALTALRQSPRLLESTPASFLGAIISAAQLGLEPNTPLGQAYLVPYKNKRINKYEAQLQIGYQGMLDLARRSGLVASVYAHVVREGDEFSYQLGLHPDLVHVPSELEGREDQAVTHVYAVARLKDGDPIFIVLTKKDVEKYRARSLASNDGPWVTDWDAMACKTAVRRLYTWLPKSAELANAIALDEAPEHGHQSAAWDGAVTDALKRQGLEIEAEGAEVAPQLDEKPPREPGEDG